MQSSYSASELIMMNMDNNNNVENKPIREAAFLFKFSSIERIKGEDFNEIIQPYLNIILDYMHGVIFKKKKLDLYDMKTINIICQELYYSVFAIMNAMPQCPFRFMIEDCCLVDCINGKGAIHANSEDLKREIQETHVIQTLFDAIKKMNKKRFELARAHSEFLIFNVVIFTKYAPLAVIDPITGDDWFDDYDDGDDWDDEDDDDKEE